MIIYNSNLLKKITNTTFETIKKVNKEGYLLNLQYIPETEEYISIKIYFNIKDDNILYELVETDIDGYIISWERRLNKEINILYPIILPGNCEKFRIVINFINTTGISGNIYLSAFANTYYNE